MLVTKRSLIGGDLWQSWMNAIERQRHYASYHHDRQESVKHLRYKQWSFNRQHKNQNSHRTGARQSEWSDSGAGQIPSPRAGHNISHASTVDDSTNRSKIDMTAHIEGSIRPLNYRQVFSVQERYDLIPNRILIFYKSEKSKNWIQQRSHVIP